MSKNDRIKECYCDLLRLAMSLYPNGAPNPIDPRELREFRDLVSAAFLATGLGDGVRAGLNQSLGKTDTIPPTNHVLMQILSVTQGQSKGQDFLADMAIAEKSGLILAAKDVMTKYHLRLMDLAPVIADDRQRVMA